MSIADSLSHLGRCAASECEPEMLRDVVVGSLRDILTPQPAEFQIKEFPYLRFGTHPPPAESEITRTIDIPNRFRVTVITTSHLTPEQEAYFDVVRSYIGLWAQARRLHVYNRFAAGTVHSLQNSPPDSQVVPRLELLAELATDVKGVESALVVALDGDERAAAMGTFGVTVDSRDATLRAANTWLDRVDKSDHPIALNGDGLPVREGFVARGYPMRVGNEQEGKLVGLLVAFVEPNRTDRIDPLLLPFARLASWVLRDALRGEVLRRLRRLQELVLLPGPTDPNEVVRSLALIFNADVVSIFLDDHGLLRLSATTDEQMRKGGSSVVYDRGECITGWVFQQGQPRRFLDANEADAFRRQNCGAEASKHPERATLGEPTARLLAVPMRHGNSVVGVLRMSRVRAQPHFTQGEEDALSFAADVLGTLLVGRWEHRVARQIQELSADAVYLARAPKRNNSFDSPIVYEHEGAARLYGRTSLVGVSAASLYSKHTVRSVTERALRGTLGTEPIDTFAILPDGSRTPLEVSIRMMKNELFSPPSVYWLVLARDVSERKKRTEETERMRNFLNHLRIAYFRSDLDGKTHHASDLDCELTGYSRKELAAQSRSMLHDDPAEREKLVADVRAAGGRLFKRIARLRRKPPRDAFFVEADLRIVHDQDGKEAGLEGFYREVTDRVTLQSFLDLDSRKLLSDSELFDKLRASAELQQDYLLSLGHQLRAPLVALIATLRNFERRIVRQEVAADRMAYVLGQTRVCIDLVQNMSFLGRILKNEPLSKQDVALARTVIRVKLDLKHLLREKHLNLIIDDDSLDQLGPLSGDPDVLRQVFVNLLDNAIKYSLPDSTIRVTGRQSSTHDTIDVTSEGLEIPSALREKIFERGYRTPQAEALVPHGTGLGLWLVRRMLDLHGARIECSSEATAPGRGRNRFRISFPRSA